MYIDNTGILKSGINYAILKLFNLLWVVLFLHNYVKLREWNSLYTNLFHVKYDVGIKTIVNWQQGD